jgi:arabinogalactan oligomer/maltooligosaccharide transport system permease protein
MKEMQTERASWLEQALTHAVLLVMVAFALYPILWVVTLALSPAGAPDARVVPLPRAIAFDHFHELFGENAEARTLFATQVKNSLIVSLVTSLSAVALAAPAAYALARRSFLGKEGGLRVLLGTQMFPAALSLLPLFLILEALGLTDSRAGLVLVYATTAVPFAIFQLKSAFESVPREIEEAARPIFKPSTWWRSRPFAPLSPPPRCLPS